MSKKLANCFIIPQDTIVPLYECRHLRWAQCVSCPHKQQQNNKTKKRKKSKSYLTAIWGIQKPWSQGIWYTLNNVPQSSEGALAWSLQAGVRHKALHHYSGVLSAPHNITQYTCSLLVHPQWQIINILAAVFAIEAIMGGNWSSFSDMIQSTSFKAKLYSVNLSINIKKNLPCWPLYGSLCWQKAVVPLHRFLAGWGHLGSPSPEGVLGLQRHWPSETPGRPPGMPDRWTVLSTGPAHTEIYSLLFISFTVIYLIYRKQVLGLSPSRSDRIIFFSRANFPPVCYCSSM